MDRDFWSERWDRGQIGFHQDAVHPDLVAQQAWFAGTEPHRILVPLCGKSVDLPWLADQGHHVIGVEFVESAVRTLFDDHGRTPEVVQHADHVQYRSGTLEVWCGDFFTLPKNAADSITRVWDRAALVAVDPTTRERYVDTVKRLAPGATLLLNALEYDPAVMSGPPFPVSPATVGELYAGHPQERLGTRDLMGPTSQWGARGHQWFRSHLYRIDLAKTA